MMSVFRVWATVLLISAVLASGLAPSAKADAIYTFNSFLGVSWSFEVSAIISTDTTITSFLSTNIAPGSFAESVGCAGIASVSITQLQTFPTIDTECAMNIPGSSFGVVSSFFEPIDHFGAYSSGALTISPSGLPEPSSLLLLAGGLTSLAGLRRKRKF